MAEASRATWRKSSHSGGGENCVELASMHGRIAVRDSKQPSGPYLTFSASEWLALMDRVRLTSRTSG